MKTPLILVLCSFLLGDGYSIPVANAQTRAPLSKEDRKKLIENMASTAQRAMKLRLEAEARAMEQCQTERVVVPLPEWDLIANTEKTVETMISITWSGACVDGKRDGDGVLSWMSETTYDPKLRNVLSNKAEGRFLKGQRLGLWCMTHTTQVFVDGQESGSSLSLSGCSVFAGHTNPLTGNYRKEPDGRWREYTIGPTDSILAAGTLEAQSAKVLAAAAAGLTDLKVDLRVQSRSLDDLVQGSKIVLAPSAAPISLKDKRVAIVLSSQAVQELERFKRERQALIEASAGLRGEAAKERDNFIQVSNPDRMLVDMLKTVQRYVKEVRVADDLSVLTAEGYDYALVMDWKSLTRLDQLGKYDSFPIPSEEVQRQGIFELAEAVSKGTLSPLLGEVISGFLINRDLKAVKSFPAQMIPSFRRQPVEGLPTGDHAYFQDLAGYFELKWGTHGGYDALRSMYYLDYFLKHLDDNPSKTQ